MRFGFIVEGFNDETTVRWVLPTAHCVVTNGTRLNNRVRMDVDRALGLCHEVLILTDPDESVDTLARMLLNEYPYMRRVLLNPNECKCYRRNKLKIGVEHCRPEYLQGVLAEFILHS